MGATRLVVALCFAAAQSVALAAVPLMAARIGHVAALDRQRMVQQLAWWRATALPREA